GTASNGVGPPAAALSTASAAGAAPGLSASSLREPPASTTALRVLTSITVAPPPLCPSRTRRVRPLFFSRSRAMCRPGRMITPVNSRLLLSADSPVAAASGKKKRSGLNSGCSHTLAKSCSGGTLGGGEAVFSGGSRAGSAVSSQCAPRPAPAQSAISNNARRAQAMPNAGVRRRRSAAFMSGISCRSRRRRADVTGQRELHFEFRRSRATGLADQIYGDVVHEHVRQCAVEIMQHARQWLHAALQGDADADSP